MGSNYSRPTPLSIIGALHAKRFAMLAFCILLASQKVGTIGREGIVYRFITYIHDEAVGRRCCVTLTPCGVDGKIAIIIRCTFRVLLGGACVGVDEAVKGGISEVRQTCCPYGRGERRYSTR